MCFLQFLSVTTLSYLYYNRYGAIYLILKNTEEMNIQNITIPSVLSGNSNKTNKAGMAHSFEMCLNFAVNIEITFPLQFCLVFIMRC